MKKVLVVSILTLISLLVRAGNGVVGSVGTKGTSYICNYTKDASYKDRPLIIKVLSADEYSLFQVAPFGNDTITVDELNFTGTQLKEKYLRTRKDDSVLEISANWGTKFSLMGYYGERKVMMNLLNGEAELHNHIIPHLIADINAPRGEEKQISPLQCFESTK